MTPNEYINNCDPPVYAKFVRIGGWYGNGFLTENGYVGGDDAKELIFHQSEAEPTGVEVKGSVEEWKENVSKPLLANFLAKPLLRNRSKIFSILYVAKQRDSKP